MNIKQIARAREALNNMDDFARMSCGVDPIGPRKVLEEFITSVAGAAVVVGPDPSTTPLHFSHGHATHCNLMFPATLGTADDHCDCGASKIAEVSAVCPQCNGTGVVSDGEIDHYPDGTPYMHGPVVCVKDCPACSLPAPGSIEALQRYGECSTRPGVMRDRKGDYVLRSEAVAWAAQHVANALKEQMEMVAKCGAKDQAEFNRKWTEQKERADVFVQACQDFRQDVLTGIDGLDNDQINSVLALFDQYIT